MAKYFSRKCLALTLLLCILMSLTVPALAASSDITGHWAEPIIKEWIDQGLMSGDSNGSYRPNDSITRAEFFTLVNNWKGYTTESDKVETYTDVSPGKWYYKQVAIALGAGYITGTSATTMAPEAEITRQEAMTVVARIAGVEAATDTSVLSKVKDGANVSEWAKGFAAAVINEGLVSGGGDGNINPTSNITRAETVALLNKVRVDTRAYAFAGTYGPASGEKTVTSITVDAPGVTLQNLTITGDLTIAKSVGEGEVTLNNVNVEGKLNVLGGGLNSIYLNNCNIKELVVEKDKVRVVLADGSVISFARMAGKDDIIELGGGTKIETMTVTGDDTTIKAGANVSIGTLNAEAGGTDIQTQAGTTIGTANLNGATTITGAGSITTANVNVADCTIETKPEATNVAPGVTAEVGGQPVTGTPPPSGGGGGTNPVAPAFARHSVSDEIVPFGTQIGDLNLPATVTLTANTGAAGTSNVTWSYGTYAPNTAGEYTITGTLSGATVAWAPTTI